GFRWLQVAERLHMNSDNKRDVPPGQDLYQLLGSLRGPRPPAVRHQAYSLPCIRQSPFEEKNVQLHQAVDMPISREVSFRVEVVVDFDGRVFKLNSNLAKQLSMGKNLRRVPVVLYLVMTIIRDKLNTAIKFNKINQLFKYFPLKLKPRGLSLYQCIPPHKNQMRMEMIKMCPIRIEIRCFFSVEVIGEIKPLSSSKVKINKKFHAIQRKLDSYENTLMINQISEIFNLQFMGKSLTVDKPNTCDMCGKGFANATKEHTLRHMRIHTGDKPYKCDVCGKGFAQNSTMQRHARTHTNNKQFAFNQRINLDTHMKTHTGDEPEKWDYTCFSIFCKTRIQEHVKQHLHGRTNFNENIKALNNFEKILTYVVISVIGTATLSNERGAYSRPLRENKLAKI
ncbi:Hypothetical predicted protein, partial [Mytilus galloprovincialis]